MAMFFCDCHVLFLDGCVSFLDGNVFLMAMLFFVMAIFFDVFVSVLQGLQDLEGPAPSSDVRQLADDPIWDALHVALQAKAPPCMDPVLVWNSPAHHTGHEMAAEVRPAVLASRSLAFFFCIEIIHIYIYISASRHVYVCSFLLRCHNKASS